MSQISSHSETYAPPEDAIIPGPTPGSEGRLSLNRWGFEDTYFEIDSGKVRLAGERYLHSGQTFDAFFDWVDDRVGIDLRDSESKAFSYQPESISESQLSSEHISKLRDIVGFDGLELDKAQRLRRGHGHALQDIYDANFGSFERVPDAVVFPRVESEIEELIEAASTLELCLIPYGGGTNVTLATRCPGGERRPIVVIDMKKLNRVRWIDPVNHIACIEAGATGSAIEKVLEAHGFTLGHEPDSLELSTLGGWIATKASGMKKNRYGNIEDVVIDFRVIAPSGIFHRNNASSRESIGFDYRSVFMGSEGRMGVISSALVKIHKAPEASQYDSMLFPSFQAGVDFFYAVKRNGVLPASLRLMDNNQFTLGQCFKETPTGLAAVQRNIQKAFLQKIKGFDLRKIAACTAVYEGSQDTVNFQKQTIARYAKEHGGLITGEGHGRQGYLLTYSIAYLRDFLLTQHVLAESFETTVPWSQVEGLIQAVIKSAQDSHAEYKLEAIPFVSYRLTQSYEDCACLYFYLALYLKDKDKPDVLYSKIEHKIREAILDAGGTLSHHHGIGKLRQDFLPRIQSASSIALNAQMKSVIDPKDTFGVCNQ
ncbi:MAG: FAD-binding oxidoreductase [Verrucomicrobiota bacterium]